MIQSTEREYLFNFSKLKIDLNFSKIEETLIDLKYYYNASIDSKCFRDFFKIYNVKFVEKESISELQYSKKDEFKQSLLNKLYTDNGNIYIIKCPKNDQYIVSTNKKILEDVLAGKDHSSHPDYQIVSKEDVKKALENKALENKVSEDKPQETAPSNVKENDFK